MLDARWTRVLLTIALLQLGLGGILAVTIDGDGADDGSVATDNTTTTTGGGSGTIPSTDPAFGTDDPGGAVSVTTTQPPPPQDTRPHLPPSK